MYHQEALNKYIVILVTQKQLDCDEIQKDYIVRWMILG